MAPLAIPTTNILVILSIGLGTKPFIISSFPNTLPYKNPNIIADIPPAISTGPKLLFLIVKIAPIMPITRPCPTSPNIKPNIKNAVIATKNVGSISV